MDEILRDLGCLVAFDTQNPPRELDAGHEMFSWLAAQLPGFEIEITDHGRGRINFLATRGQPQLLFNVHLDTVPIGDAADWKRPPLQLTIEGDRAYGRGSCDIKGAAAVLLAVARHSDAPMAVLFSTDEEGAEGCCIDRFTADTDLDRWRQVVVAEPTNCHAVLSHRGYLSVKTRFAGHAGHSSEARALEDNALHRAARWIDAAVGHAQALDAQGRRPCFNVGTLSGGIKSNVIADAAQLHWSARLAPGESNEEYLATLRELPAASTASDWQVPFSGPPLPAAGQDAGPAQAFVDQHELPAGEPVNFWTEASLFSDAGRPALVLGPGDIAQAHTVDEWVSLDQLQQAYAIYHRLVSSHA